MNTSLIEVGPVLSRFCIFIRLDQSDQLSQSDQSDQPNNQIESFLSDQFLSDKSNQNNSSQTVA